MAKDYKVDNVGDLGSGLQKWCDDLEKKTSGLSSIDQSLVAMSGAQVFEKHLREVTKQKHYSTHNDKKYGHAADHISMYEPKEGSMGDANTRFVSFIVGWPKHYHAMNMMRVNDGTSKIVGDNFITNLRNDPKVHAEILKAEQKKYEDVTNKGDD